MWAIDPTYPDLSWLSIIHKLVVVCQYTGQPVGVPPWVHSLCWRLCVLRGAEFHDSVDESIAFSFSLPTLLNTRYFTNTFPSLICFCSLDGPTLSALFIHVAYRKWIWLHSLGYPVIRRRWMKWYQGCCKSGKPFSFIIVSDHGGAILVCFGTTDL